MGPAVIQDTVGH